jgi:hypothetical protein
LIFVFDFVGCSENAEKGSIKITNINESFFMKYSSDMVYIALTRL